MISIETLLTIIIIELAAVGILLSWGLIHIVERHDRELERLDHIYSLLEQGDADGDTYELELEEAHNVTSSA